MAALTVLGDDFLGTTLDTTKWSDGSGANGTQTVSGGRLHLQPNPGSGTPQAVITTATTYTWASSFVYARLLPSAQAGARVSMIVGDNASPGMIEVAIQDGQVYLTVTGTTGTVSPNNGVLGTYDPAAFEYLMIDLTTNTPFIKRSADANTFVTLTTGPFTANWSANAYVKLRTTAQPGQAQTEGQVDTVNLKAPPDATLASVGPRMSITRPAGTAQRSTARVATSAPRTYTVRSKDGAVASNAGGYAAVPTQTRIKGTRPAGTGTAVTGGAGTATKPRPTAGLLWPRAK